MLNIEKLLKQSDAGFKRYTGIHKATFEEMLEAIHQHEAQNTKSGRPSALSLEEQILLALIGVNTERFAISAQALIFMSLLSVELFEK